MAECEKRLQAPKTIVVVNDSVVPEYLPKNCTVLVISRDYQTEESSQTEA